MRVYWKNNVKDLSLLYRDYFVFGDLQGMLFRHKTLHLTAELTGKENTTKNLQQQEAGPSGLFPVRIIFLKSRLIYDSVITIGGGVRVRGPGLIQYKTRINCRTGSRKTVGRSFCSIGLKAVVLS